jgi:adenine-specific DNA methylase
VTVSLSDNHVQNDFPCPKCGAQLTKEVKGASGKGATVVERLIETYFDDVLGRTAQRLKRVPVLLSYDVGRIRYEKSPDDDDLARINRAESKPITAWVPVVPIAKGDKTGDPYRAGIAYIHQYHARRTLHVLASLFESLRGQRGLVGFLTSILTRCSWQNRYRPQHRGNRSREVVGPLSGTLYIPPFSLEINPVAYGQEKSREITKRLGAISRTGAIISTQSANQLPDSLAGVVDYVFSDPPFGSNLQYSELSFAMEGWLKVRTNIGSETVVNDTRQLGLHDYGEGMRRAFLEVYRALKPGRWVTIEFHNSQNAVWNVIQTAVLESGLVIADVRTLDKVKGTTKQLTQANAVKQDLIVTAYRPDSSEALPPTNWRLYNQHRSRSVPVYAIKR